MTISGGNDHSLFICTKGVLYACGDNSDGRLGLTAPNAGTQYVPTFSQVDVSGLSFEQVTAGSGAHNVALACNGLVYCWGANAELQCGVAGGGSVSSPTPVLCGEAEGYDENGNKGGIYLGGVTFIAASTSASFALLEDGTVVGWGGNSSYGGGKWIETPTSTPKFIRTPDGKVLQGVTFIAGGDNNLLLKVDPDGDGLGDAYSVGTYNGRGGGLGAQEYYAEPVLLYMDETQDGMKQGPGDPLTNIRMLAAGDAAGFAVDGITGYVYAWGENGGNGRCGPPYAADYLYAAKMVAGDYQRISNESYLTNVKEVVGGNGWGAAITNEGYMLYWGKNNDPTFATWGGTVPDPDFSGQGTNAADATIVYNGVVQPHKNGPVFAKYEDNSIVDNAVHLGRGDLFGFMSNSEDKYFVWGQTQSTATGNPHTGHMATGKVEDFKNYLHEIKTPCAPADP
jgi:alpha-tubulin suppressor-like RCC1 family protein